MSGTMGYKKRSGYNCHRCGSFNTWVICDMSIECLMCGAVFYPGGTK